MRSVFGLGWKGAVLAALIVVVLVGGTGAAVCRFTDVACGINPGIAVGTAPDSLDDFSSRGRGEMSVVEPLVATTVVGELRFPTDLDFLPDGRILVAQKDGLVVVVEDGVVLERPFLDLRAKVNTHFFRGVMDVTLDPAYPRRPYVYAVYAVRNRTGTPASARPTSVVLSRFDVREDVAVPGSERILVGRRSGRSCEALPKGADCIPATGTHVGADIAFAPDGTMFVSTGDGGGEAERVERTAFSAQDLDSLGGKILRIDREGRGLPENPFWNGDASSNRSKVWAYGLRNPFRITLAPDRRNALIVGDVGWDTHEELNVVERGRNYGWPCFEGPERTPKYRENDFCTSFYARDPDVVEPWHSAAQADGLSITGGVTLPEAAGWPPDLEGNYVFGDWVKSEIYALPARTSERAGEPRVIGTNAAGPVAFALGPDGLYVLALNAGELRRIAAP